MSNESKPTLDSLYRQNRSKLSNEIMQLHDEILQLHDEKDELAAEVKQLQDEFAQAREHWDAREACIIRYTNWLNDDRAKLKAEIARLQNNQPEE